MKNECFKSQRKEKVNVIIMKIRKFYFTLKYLLMLSMAMKNNGRRKFVVLIKCYTYIDTII